SRCTSCPTSSSGWPRGPRCTRSSPCSSTGSARSPSTARCPPVPSPTSPSRSPRSPRGSCSVPSPPGAGCAGSRAADRPRTDPAGHRPAGSVLSAQGWTSTERRGMSRMMEAWHRRTGPERFETYTRWTLYILLGFVPLVALAVIEPQTLEPSDLPAIAVYLGVVAVQTVLSIVVIRDGVTAFRDTTPLRRGPAAVLLAVTGAAVVAAVVALPPAETMGWLGRGAGVLLPLAVGLWAFTPVLTAPVLIPASVACSFVAALANTPALGWAMVVPSALMFGIVMVALTPSFRISVWMLGVVWEQERTRQLHARLAVAEERLRFSRDLHDVLGRALSAMALKSELGAELSRRGQAERAAEQMLEVRELANDSLKEVRAVVAGYRQADVAT